ncbi:MAG: sugar O-acetyltransferase [Cyclobacteriaceae bacterium]|nr:sugar O-acetyltransferase [Cyclobacteriaceae bacterium]
MMSEKDKMLAGELYDAEDPVLKQERLQARMHLQSYNLSNPDNIDLRSEILRKLIPESEKIRIEPPFYCDYGYNINAGDNFYANFNCVILDVCRVKIGKNVMFGPYVQIYTATHPLIASERIKGPEAGKPIIIGDNVWIGGGAIVCPGVSIGKNTTIGAGSVVTRDIPDNVFAAGNPCRVIKDL